MEVDTGRTHFYMHNPRWVLGMVIDNLITICSEEDTSTVLAATNCQVPTLIGPNLVNLDISMDLGFG